MQRRENEMPDEGLIHAWLDGELEADEAARVERLVAEDAAWAAAAAEARGVIAASSRILGHLDVVAGDVIPRGGSAAPGLGADAGRDAGEPRVPKPSVAPRRVVPTWMRVAAGVVLVAGVAYLGRDAREMAVAPEVVVTNEPARADAEVAEPMAAVSAMAAPAAASAPAAADAAAPAPRAAAEGSANQARAMDAPAAPVSAPSAAKLATLDSASLRRGAEPERILESPNAISVVTADAAPAAAKQAAAAPAQERRAMAARAEDAAGRAAGVAGGVAAQPLVAAPQLAATAVTGCWRTQSAESIAPVQRNPQIVRLAGDTLVLALQPGGTEARVLRFHADSLRGVRLDAAGQRLPFIAVRTPCTP